MATETFPNKPATEAMSLNPMDLARAIVSPLASLKLTVCLLVLGVAVTFIATLDQTRADVRDVKMKHFESLMVRVPYQTFLVPDWFPNHQNIEGSFYIPSGLTILVLMLINLSTAHILRFRLQATGMKLVIGLIVGAFAAFFTWAVIFNGQNADGFQTQPPIPLTQMWTLLKVGLLGLAIASIAGWLMIDKLRKAERLLLAISAIACAGVLGVTVYLGEAAFIGEPAIANPLAANPSHNGCVGCVFGMPFTVQSQSRNRAVASGNCWIDA